MKHLKKTTNTILAQRIVVASACSLSLLLAGCSDKPENNPLRKDPKATGLFLLKASYAAEKKVGQHLEGNYRNEATGNYYGDCMVHIFKAKSCHVLYQAMVDYARQQKGYRDITLANITDRGMWDLVKRYYEKDALTMPLDD